MASKQGLMERWDNVPISKTAVFWACAGSIVATMIVGFTWGGWVTGGTANKMVTEATTGARAELAATVCVDRFAKGPDAKAQLALLNGTESWKRDQFIEDGGWATPPGAEKAIAGAAAICARQIIEAMPPVKAAGVSG